jgi:hypothetical protein
MMVLRARRGGTGSKYVTFRGRLRRAIPFLLVGSGAGRKSSNLYGTPEGVWPAEALAITEAERAALATHRAETAEKKGRRRSVPKAP